MYDSKYDSKMHDIIIPLMGFNGFHHASNNESKDDFDDFIGRESILDKLNSWLVDHEVKKEKKYSGAYLISGFRGMGKSSFVYKAILDMKKKAKKHKFTTCHYVPISINVGNDLLTSKEMLYIICKLLSVTFDEKTRIGHNKRSRLNIMLFQLIVIIAAVLMIIFGFDLVDGFITSHYIFNNPLGKIIKRTYLTHKGLYYFGVVAIALLLCYFSRFLYYVIWRYTDWSFFITTWQIKKTFRFLNKRIDSEMTESSEYGFDSAKNSKPYDMVPGLRFIKNRKNFYPIAQTAEIQDLLVNQLRLIKHLWLAKFRFIFIIDELDKVSPEDDEKQIIPEYEYTNAVKGHSSYRSRQMALASLLANMKYFISSSEAKFVFITGYDMYEATLADISNREFNIHSIFNGYINVSSFLRRTGKSTGADSMIEEYFTHLILRGKDSEKREDLGDYANFFRQEWETKDLLTNEGLKHFELLLERRILFMRHFLTYLFYMSNGSPKKLAMYLEKYVRSKQRVTEQIKLKSQKDVQLEYQDISLGIDDYWTKCEWFLYFDERNIQKIEFVNYLIYPMIKNLIAKSSIYNDKLLVSTSFMISNLYKFHKSGFSWRNLEYMPELLDINKTPELRDFIGGIMQFLNQTHIDDAALNLYKFKFPQRLSEEITFYSKTSEEISYLFNFSHDELLSIKTLYNKQLDHYNKKALYESPAIASLHHLLGDIYILEENYEQAIFEYSEALNAISRQIKDNPEGKEDVSKILFRIRLSLKLGLAFEKRKTFDTAYITYESVVKMILEIVSNAVQLPHMLNNLFGTPNVTDHLNSKASFFSNMRIAYLAILAKIAVIEKMDFGGIDDHDLLKLSQEFNIITNKLGDEIKPLAIMDFHNKLGSILYYKNSRNNEDFIGTLQEILQLTTNYDTDKFGECTKQPVIPEGKSASKNPVATKNLLTPCTACQYFNKSIKTCMDTLNDDKSTNPTEKYAKTSKAIFFLKQFHNRDLANKVQLQGNLFLQVMSSSLLGLGNTLLSCAKIGNEDLTEFFNDLYKICNRLDNDTSTKIQKLERLENKKLSPYSKSILYYLAAADGYKLLTDYKASYNIYVQILDAVSIYYRAIAQKPIPDRTLKFCQTITRKAIHCAYLHYDSINCAEVDTQKHEFGKSHSDYINLHGLAVFPEVQLAIDKYQRICLLGDEQTRNSVLKKVLNSRQLGSYKLISTLTQNIQNLSLKVTVNEEILSRIMPDLWKSVMNLDLHFGNTIEWIHYYYTNDSSSKTVESLLMELDWHILNDVKDTKEKKFCLLDYLLKDSLYCLNLITELIEPLYSTTLYNDSYIAEFYRKAFYWNHILICVRELFNFTESDDEKRFAEELRARYSTTRKDTDFNKVEKAFRETKDFLNLLDSWKNYCDEGISRVHCMYNHIAPGSSNLLTSSYLTGMALDHLDKAIEMHTSGKAYKEMMSTLYFLEDDLQNDANYMHLAVERFLINHGILRDRIIQLREFALSHSPLVQSDNYVKP